MCRGPLVSSHLWGLPTKIRVVLRGGPAALISSRREREPLALNRLPARAALADEAPAVLLAPFGAVLCLVGFSGRGSRRLPCRTDETV